MCAVRSYASVLMCMKLASVGLTFPQQGRTKVNEATILLYYCTMSVQIDSAMNETMGIVSAFIVRTESKATENGPFLLPANVLF